MKCPPIYCLGEQKSLCDDDDDDVNIIAKLRESQGTKKHKSVYARAAISPVCLASAQTIVFYYLLTYLLIFAEWFHGHLLEQSTAVYYN